jgi:hypothetical protein
MELELSQWLIPLEPGRHTCAYTYIYCFLRNHNLMHIFYLSLSGKLYRRRTEYVLRENRARSGV